MLGHSDRAGSCCGDRAQSWNSAHPSRGGIYGALSAMGRAALFYCFAVDQHRDVASAPPTAIGATRAVPSGRTCPLPAITKDFLA